MNIETERADEILRLCWIIRIRQFKQLLYRSADAWIRTLVVYRQDAVYIGQDDEWVGRMRRHVGYDVGGGIEVNPVDVLDGSSIGTSGYHV